MKRPIFSALANKTRADIFHALRDGELNVSQIMRRLKLKQALVSNSLKILADADLVVSRPDGNYRYFSLNRPFADKILQAMDFYVGDVRAAHRKDIKAKEAEIMQIMAASPDAIMIYPVKGARFSYVNAAGVALLGAESAETVLKTDTRRFIPKEARKCTGRMLKRLGRGRAVPMTETKLRRMDGSLVDVEVSATPILRKNERAVLITARDITNRVNGRRKLRVAAGRSRAVLEAIPAFVAIAGKDHGIRYINHPLPQYTREQFLKSDVADYVDGPDKKKLHTAVNAVLRTGKARNVAVRGEAPGRGWITYDVHVVLLEQLEDLPREVVVIATPTMREK